MTTIGYCARREAVLTPRPTCRCEHEYEIAVDMPPKDENGEYVCQSIAMYRRCRKCRRQDWRWGGSNMPWVAKDGVAILDDPADRRDWTPDTMDEPDPAILNYYGPGERKVDEP